VPHRYCLKLATSVVSHLLLLSKPVVCVRILVGAKACRDETATDADESGKRTTYQGKAINDVNLVRPVSVASIDYCNAVGLHHCPKR